MPIEWFDGVSLTVEAALSAATGDPLPLDANPDFEVDLAPWDAIGCTVTRSSVWSQQGQYSAKITSLGTGPSAYIECEMVPVVAGRVYIASGWLYSPTTWPTVNTSNGVSVNWFDASQAYISTSLSGGNTLPAGVPVGISTPFVAPPGAAWATLVPGIGGSPPAGQVVYVDAVTLSLPSGYGAWDTGRWGSATWGPDEQWTDISAYARAIRSDRRFSREVQYWDAGSAQFVLANRDGRFSADNIAGPYVVGGVTGVRPWRPMRWSATYKGITYRGFTGYGLDLVDTWLPGHSDAYVTWPATDEMGVLTEVDGLAQTAQGAGDTSGARVHRLLNSAGHTGPRNIAPGRVTMQATTGAANVATELRLVADSEGGSLFVAEDGTVVFEDQYALLEQPRSNTVQATFGDGSGSELPCADITPTSTGSLIKNIVSYQRVGGTAQTVVDPTSRALYRDKRASRTDLICESDVQAAALAAFYLQRYKEPAKRFSRIQIKPRTNPQRLFPAVLGLRVRDLIRVVARPLGGPPVIRDCHVAGIHHDISRDDWVVTLDLWDASVYRTYANSRWNVANWDAAAWFF